ncbi:MAG: energy-coupling factor transporter ATPase [Acholeplasmataceae bacterium]|nr:energy-coupling factor transporter ATPase [Acholeplasmataceae bacterium]
MGIRFREVSYHYPQNHLQFHQAIEKISFQVSAKGEFIALVGHTGSGKSTLAQHMNALIFPTEGSVEIFGHSVTRKRNRKIRYNDLRKHVGLVFQFPEYQLFEETVEKDIIFGPLNYKVPLDEAKTIALKTLAQVGLDESYLNRNPFNLSGGEKKRVSIAGILALDPDILVLDEPTSGLDPEGKRVLMDLFQSIQFETDKTIVIITHDMDLVYQYTSRVLVMNQGKLVFDGTPEKLFRTAPLTEYQLSMPETIKVLQAINERLGLSIDIYQKTAEAAIQAIKEAVRQ